MFIQVYKAIFTSPSSAKDVSEEEADIENMPPFKSQRSSSASNKPVRRNVASKVHLNNKVTPRSIAYAAVQVGQLLLHVILRLSTVSSSISICKLRTLGPQFMEDSIIKVYIITLLMPSKIPQGPLQRSAPRIYLAGGQCKYPFFSQRIFN